MTPRTRAQPVPGLRRVILWMRIVGLLLPVSLAWTAAIGDQVELHARNRAGVPFHREPRGTHDFQRVPPGTRATVLDVVQDGRWLKLALPDGRTGWVTSSYLRDRTPVPSTATSPPAKPPQHVEEGVVERVADGDTLTVITPNQTTLRIRMLGIDAPETPKAPGSPANLTARPRRPLSRNSSTASGSGWKFMGWTVTSGC
jgi:Bacterial SH3 domain